MFGCAILLSTPIIDRSIFSHVHRLLSAFSAVASHSSPALQRSRIRHDKCLLCSSMEVDTGAVDVVKESSGTVLLTAHERAAGSLDDSLMQLSEGQWLIAR